MCTLCQTLKPELDVYDNHGIESLGSGSLNASLQTGAQTSGSGGLPYYSYDQIAEYLTDGYWAGTGRDARAFDVKTGDTLTVDLSGLDSKGASTARIALDAWTAASGLKFKEITPPSIGEFVPTKVVYENGDVGQTNSSALRLNVGEQFRGSISQAWEKDLFKVELEAGKTYTFVMGGDGASGEISDPFLSVRNGLTQTLARSSDRANNSGTTAVEFTPSTSGTYYIEAIGYSSASGRYKLNLMESSPTISADITFDDNNTGAYASAFIQGDTILRSTVNIDDAWSSNSNYYLQTYIHEIGHALGLGHAGYYNGGASFSRDAHYANDSWQASVMSYFDQRENPNIDASFAYVASAQMADIIAIQNLYGAPAQTHHGNSVYGEGQNVGQWGMGFGAGLAVTIHDTGGIDLINLAKSTADQRIDLNPGTFSDINGKKGIVGISTTTIIENVNTGSGDDRIIGNDVGNVISTGSGDDFVDGRGGIDTVVSTGKAGSFTVIYDAEAANGGVIKLKSSAGDIDTLKNVEILRFDDKSMNVADLLASLKASHGHISTGSNASYSVSLSDIGSVVTPPVIPPVTQPPSSESLGMEIGSTRIEQLSSSYWQKVTFDRAIENAAVVMGPASSEGDDPLNIRVRNVTDTGFEFQVDEWDYLDGYHGEVSVSWMAGSIGSHTLADGTKITFGQQAVSSAAPTTVNFSGYDDTPMIFAQLTGDREKKALIERLYNIDNDSFDFILQAEEARNPSLSSIASEDLYWVALDIAGGSSIFKGGSLDLTEKYAGLGTQLGAGKGFFADIQSLFGGDTVGLRYKHYDNGGVGLRLEEEQSKDKELAHIPEDVAWFTADHGVFDFV